MLQISKSRMIKVRFWMSNHHYKPWRTCVACREKREKQQLVRFVLIQDSVHVDADFKLTGRGAYTCANSKCLETAIQRNAFHRAFRRDVNINAQLLAKEFSACLKRK